MPGQNVLNLLAQTRQMLHEYHYKYVYIGCGDHQPSDGKPFQHNCTDDLCTDCTPAGIAIFLLVVEEGVFLGSARTPGPVIMRTGHIVADY